MSNFEAQKILSFIVDRETRIIVDESESYTITVDDKVVSGLEVPSLAIGSLVNQDIIELEHEDPAKSTSIFRLTDNGWRHIRT